MLEVTVVDVLTFVLDSLSFVCWASLVFWNCENFGNLKPNLSFVKLLR